MPIEVCTIASPASSLGDRLSRMLDLGVLEFGESHWPAAAVSSTREHPSGAGHPPPRARAGPSATNTLASPGPVESDCGCYGGPGSVSGPSLPWARELR